MKHNNIYVFILLSVMLFSCTKDRESYDNKVYIDASSKVNNLVIKGDVVNEERAIQVALAKPEMEDIILTCKADPSPSQVKTYNGAYYDEAVALPDQHYELSESKLTITAGAVRSTSISVFFYNINELDRDLTYVLPVTIADANIGILQSARTVYYVFKGASLINVVADIEDNYLHIDQWTNPSVVNNLSQLTMEALIRCRDYDRTISTVMGIEGKFLIRIGDAGFPANQIQIATSDGNFPDADSKKGLPTNEWIHIALTYNSSGGEMILYVNGKEQDKAIKNLGGGVNLGVNGVDGFYIGRSYEDNRYLAGEVTECRIWNTVRTQEEIANHFYGVDPDSEGLVAYWKCDEGEGNMVKDHTGNNNHLTSKSNLKWTKVSLPASNK